MDQFLSENNNDESVNIYYCCIKQKRNYCITFQDDKYKFEKGKSSFSLHSVSAWINLKDISVCCDKDSFGVGYPQLLNQCVCTNNLAFKHHELDVRSCVLRRNIHVSQERLLKVK